MYIYCMWNPVQDDSDQQIERLSQTRCQDVFHRPIHPSTGAEPIEVSPHVPKTPTQYNVDS